ncbi:MAG TPA: hypothetical protein VGJ91_16360 [Polyangiaceae bacterium]|jgi:hypothetical protein
MQNEFKERRERVLAAIRPGLLLSPSAPLALVNHGSERASPPAPCFSATGLDQSACASSRKRQRVQRLTGCARAESEPAFRNGAGAAAERAVCPLGACVAFIFGDLPRRFGGPARARARGHASRAAESRGLAARSEHHARVSGGRSIASGGAIIQRVNESFGSRAA